MLANRALLKGGKALLDLSFPKACATCGKDTEDSPYPHACLSCCRRIHVIDDPRCKVCGYPFFGDTESKWACPHCERLSPSYVEGRSLALFRGPVKAWLRSLKYEAGFWAIEDVAELAKRSPGLDAYLKDAILVPVPLHSRRFRERSYNQSALIARAIGSAGDNCQVQDALSRVLDTVSQTRFNRVERLRNLKNAFSLRPNHAIEPGKRYIVVDDVFTTGSTINACAAALRKGGAERVDVLTVGHG